MAVDLGMSVRWGRRVGGFARSIWRQGFRARLGVVLFLLLVILAVLGPTLAPFGVNDQELANRLNPPVGFGGDWSHPLGTDFLGRDVFSRVLHGARTSLTVATLVVVFSGIIGSALGIVAGYRRGVVGILIMRWVDVWMAIPGLVIALLVLVYLGASKWSVIFVLTAIYWTLFTQVSRSAALSLSNASFVEAARVCGSKSSRIMIRHVVPHWISPLSVLAILEFAKVLISEATLSFLGFGIQPPEASWGLDIALGRAYLFSAWWLVTVPGVALTLTVLAVHYIGRWLREPQAPQRATAS